MNNKTSPAYMWAIIMLITVVIVGFVSLVILKIDTGEYIRFLIMLPGFTAAIIGVILVKQVGDAKNVAEVTADISKVAAEDIKVVKKQTNGRIDDLDDKLVTLLARIPEPETGRHSADKD